MLKRFWDDIVFLNLNRFENIGIDFYINVFLFFVAVVFCLFAVYTEITRGSMQLFISQLKRHKATSIDDAKTLGELGLSSNRIIKYIIKNNRMLSRIINRTDKKSYTYEEYVSLKSKERKNAEKIDFESERFYICPEFSSRADDIYSNYGFSITRLLFFCLFIFIIFVALASISLEILCYINNALAK